MSEQETVTNIIPIIIKELNQTETIFSMKEFPKIQIDTKIKLIKKAIRVV